MKKNAFTLVELIATIGLLGMLATITITISVRKINETKEKARDTMFESFELAAKQYVTDYENELTQFKNNDNIYISLQTLVEKEYFTESLVDPTTKKSIALTNEVYVIREESGEIKSTYNVNQRKEPKLTLIGSYNEYVEEGKEYVEKGVIAINTNKQDVSENITITGAVDTTTPDTYKIMYELDNVKITRNVIVYSRNISSEEILKTSTYIERLYKTNNYQNDELYNPKVTYEGKEYDTGIRYRGENPNNYLYFNCDDKDSNNIKYGEKNYNYKDSCEVWRIIGVFNVDNGNGKIEKRVKLVNTASTFTASWDSSASNVNSGYGVNQWGESTYEDGSTYEGADLMRLLNGYYIGKSGSQCKYNDINGQSDFEHTCDIEGDKLKDKKMKPLTSSALGMIEKTVLYNYATNTKLYPITNNTANAVYLQENGIEKQYTGCIEAETTSCEVDGVVRKNVWIGLVGLMSASDIAYANGWLYNNTIFPWTYIPTSASGLAQGIWNSYPECVGTMPAGDSYGVWPSLYLKSSVKIKGGTGSRTSPYILSQ